MICHRQAIDRVPNVGHPAVLGDTAREISNGLPQR